MFFLPNILIRSFIKKENMNLIHEISNVVQSLELSLSANIPIYKSLAISVNVIKYKRFKNSYIKFIEDYKMYNIVSKYIYFSWISYIYANFWWSAKFFCIKEEKWKI